MAATKRYDVKDLALAPEGVRRIEWADRQMPVLAAIRERFEREQPLAGHRVSACLHVTTETANLARTLKAGGADVVLCASNPLSTQDDVAAALVEEYGIAVFAIKGEDNDTYYRHIEAAVDHRPHLTMDDGADVIGVLHSHRREQLGDVIAGTEETTTGVIRLKALEREGKLGFPVIAVNEARTKHLFDNRYGTGPVHDRRHHPRHQRPARRRALRRRRLRLGRPRRRACAPAGMGAHVIVTEVDPMRALEAAMDGFEVMPMERAAEIGDVFCTATGDKGVITPRAHGAHEGRRDPREHRPLQRRDRDPARSATLPSRRARPASSWTSSRSPTAAASTSSARAGSSTSPRPRGIRRSSWTCRSRTRRSRRSGSSRTAPTLERRVYDVPREIDDEIARLKLETMGIGIDQLTEEQARLPGLVGRGDGVAGALEPERIVRLEPDAVVAARPAPASRTRRSSSPALDATRSPRRSARSRSAAPPRSASRRRTGMRSPPRAGEDLDEAYERLLVRVAADGRQPRAGRSTRCAATPTPASAPARSTRPRSTAAGAWPRTRPG